MKNPRWSRYAVTCSLVLSPALARAQDAASDETFEESVDAPSTPEAADTAPKVEEAKPAVVPNGPDADAPSVEAPKVKEKEASKTEEEAEEAAEEQSTPPVEKKEAVAEKVAEPHAASSDEVFGKSVGKTKIHIGASQPHFTQIKYYKDLYGSENGMFNFNIDRFFFASSFTAGMGFHFGYYKDEGKVALNKPVDGKVQQDPESDSEITLLPMQFVATLQASPFPQRWVSLQAWGGVEYLFIQEVRHPKSTSTTTTTPTTSGTSTTNDQPKTYVNSGANYGSVFGIGMSFRLDSIDKKTVSTLPTMGLRSVYLTPYIEQVTTIHRELGKWDRMSYGLLFTFESLK